MAGTAEKDLNKQQKFLCCILIIGIIVVAVSVVLSYRFRKDENPVPRTDIVMLYNATKPCSIHVHVDCDAKPDDLVVITPDGTEIPDFLWENEHAANIMVECTTDGQWMLRYTAPDDDSVRIHTDIIPIDRLVLRDFEVTNHGTLLEISFTPYYGDGRQTDQYFNWSLYATNSAHTRHMLIDSAEFIPVNVPVTIVCHLSELPSDVDKLQFLTDSPYQTDTNTDVLHNNTMIDVEVPDDQTLETEASETTT